MKTHPIVVWLAPLFAPIGLIAQDDLVVHEWGTFTSVFGSNGAVLPGLEIDEERLPYFVYAHDMDRGAMQFKLEGSDKPLNGFMFSKGLARPLSNVTVKMETPVLYFYSTDSFDAEVSVGFKNGTISQWYPARSGGELPPPLTRRKDGSWISGPMDFSEPYKGAIKWNFRVEPRDEHTEFDVMKVGETSTWLHPRAPKSNVLRTESGQTETYLFYRGLGNFEQPISFEATDQQLLARSDREIPFLLVLDWNDNGARIAFSGKPNSKQPIKIGLSANDDRQPMHELRGVIYRDLHAALSDAGLYPDESAAMLRTWWHSYFGQPGLRAFWVVPRDFTDEILPIQFDPKPAAIERVLLGRCEILTPAFEEILKVEFAKKDKNRFGLDRYHRAYGTRVEQLTKKATVGL